MNISEFSNRLVTLCEGRLGLRGLIHIDSLEPAPAIRIPSPGGEGQGEGATCVLDFISSDETLDRYDEIISASGWKLANYQRNPVFQNAHQYGDVIFTIGKALITEVRSGRLYQQIEFACAVNPMARIAYGLYRAKFLNAVSVGFIPIRWQNADGAEHTIGKDAFRNLPDQNPERMKENSPGLRGTSYPGLPSAAIAPPLLSPGGEGEGGEEAV